jgi:DNA-binding winged helix-turn-helix (wHTH) protein
MSKPTSHLVSFGAFELNVSAAELKQNGIRVPLQNQPLQILMELTRRAGEIVTREELRQLLWAEETFVDYEQSLNKAINKLRYALGEDAQNPQWIETVARRGYRFMGALSGQSHAQKLEANNKDGKIRIGIFPFHSVGVHGELEEFCHGLHEEICYAIGQLHHKKITIFPQQEGRELERDLHQLAKECSLHYAIGGSVRRAGAGLRVTAKILSVQETSLLWIGAQDAASNADSLKFQMQLSEQIAGALHSVLLDTLSESAAI